MVVENLLRLGIARFLCIPLSVTVVLSSSLPFQTPLTSSAAASLSHHHHQRRRLSSGYSMNSQQLSQSQSPPPPVAKKVEHKMEMFGDVRIDNYYWLRDDSRTNPEVLSYLKEENGYTDSIMSGVNSHFLILFIRILLHCDEICLSFLKKRSSLHSYTSL